MDNACILIPFRFGCLILGALLMIMGGMSLAFDLVQLKNLEVNRLMNRNRPARRHEGDPDLAQNICNELLYLINGAVVLLSTIYYYRIPPVLKGCGCLMLGQGAFPILTEIKPFRFERSFSEVAAAFCTVRMFMHFYAAYVLWRYSEEVRYEEVELALKRRLGFVRRQQEETDAKLKEFEGRQGPRGSGDAGASPRGGGADEARLRGTEDVPQQPGDSKARTRKRRSFLTHASAPESNEEFDRPGRIKTPKKAPGEGGVESMLQAFKNPTRSLRSSLNAAESDSQSKKTTIQVPKSSKISSGDGDPEDFPVDNQTLTSLASPQLTSMGAPESSCRCFSRYLDQISKPATLENKSPLNAAETNEPSSGSLAETSDISMILQSLDGPRGEPYAPGPSSKASSTQEQPDKSSRGSSRRASL